MVITGVLAAGLALAKGMQLRQDRLDSLPAWRPGDWPPVPTPARGAQAEGGHGGQEQ